MRNVLVVTSLLLALAGGACSPTLAPVYSPAQTAGVNGMGVPYTASEIDQAAVAGAQAKGWTILSHAPGLTVAEVSAGGHGARVRIATNEAGWRIEHDQSSPGLNYGSDARHGAVIHRRYNHWVRLLDEAIRQQLAHLTPAAPTAATEPAPQAPPAPDATAQ
ncbi:MAG: hypothetical protein ABW352_01630 [Polyangiales bacterium]